ncbi:MAG: hypothetical protein QOI04_1125 [Verrucomicrobiota bacterium]|jgi:asparagine synthase (glutamine-hydrolysing)
MCGIAAIFGHHADAPSVDRDELIAIRDRMIHRGPDGEGLWISEDRHIGLAHRRLTIVDLTDAGLQPMWNADRTLCVTYNGEIYNYPALRAQLSERGHQFISNCDTEILLHLYAEKGSEMVHELRGMYAFAIWDAQKRTLFLARDPFGIKPLYYADDGRTIRVASQVKALLAGKGIDTAPEAAAHVAFFLWGSVPDPFTLFRGIRALPAGHTLTLRAGGNLEIRAFVSIPEILREAEAVAHENKNGSQDRHEILHAALHDSAEHHLMADVPVGVFQSAGLDSSTITALVSERHHDVRTVTLGFNEYRGSAQDETRLAEVVARNYKTNHNTIWITRRDFEGEAARLFEAMDRPSIDGVNTYFVSLAAKRTGLKVALSGLGGDELFGGYPSFQDIPRVVRMMKHVPTLGVVFGKGIRAVSNKMLRRFTSPKYAGIFEYGSSYPGAYLLRRSLFMPWELPEFLDPDLVREGWRRLNTFGELAALCDSLDSERLKVSALELCWYMRHQLLRDSDWAGMAHSLEIRVPLVDLKLLRTIAPLLASAHPPGKIDMARSPRSPLPEAVLLRPKTGFTVPVRDWLLQSFDPLSAHERGLRGWARYVHGEFAQQSGASSTVLRATRPGGASHGLRQRRSGRAATSRKSSRILVYRIGQLGDTIVALPAMWAIRENFPDAKLTLLCDQHPHSNYVLASDLLQGAGIFDDFFAYPVEKGGTSSPRRAAELLRKLREQKFDTLAYLAPSARGPARVQRDKWFFRAAGISNFIGMTGFPRFQKRDARAPLATVPRESELLLLRLRESGLRVSLQNPRFDLGFGQSEEHEVSQWLRSQTQSDGGRQWIAVGPGSKMPAKQWPLERYDEVVRDLIASFDIWPVVFGGAEDREIGEGLVERWSRGYNAAGSLGVRAAGVALKNCLLYLGNDTGTMHLAAAAAVRCVAVFSSRERPGVWYPAGSDNRVFRSEIDCEGCGLKVCITRDIECLRHIDSQSVLAACAELLSATSAYRVVPATLAPVSVL